MTTSRPEAEQPVISRVVDGVFLAARWLILPMVLLQFTIVMLRYVYGVNWIAMQELIVALHGVMFLLGFGGVLVRNHHVRVEVFYSLLSLRAKRRFDKLGALFLGLPFVGLILYSCTPYVIRSWRNLEGSSEPAGLPGVFLTKSVILVGFALLAAQLIVVLTTGWRRRRRPADTADSI